MVLVQDGEFGGPHVFELADPGVAQGADDPHAFTEVAAQELAYDDDAVEQFSLELDLLAVGMDVVGQGDGVGRGVDEGLQGRLS